MFASESFLKVKEQMICKQIRQDEQTHHPAPFNQVNYLILAKAKFQYWLIVIYIRRHNRFSNFIHPNTIYIMV